VLVEGSYALDGRGVVPRRAGSKIFFTSGGSDSVDTAAKLARRYWHEVGQPEKAIIVGRQKAYHGMHVAGTALAGIPVNREGYGELMADAATVGWDDAKSLLELIERIGANKIAAFFAEPIIGAGGVYLPPEGYLAEVRDICREHDILFVVDEVVTGFGRIGGEWFASTRFDLQPDMMTTAKGLTSGYVPMGAVFIAPRVAEPFYAGSWWRHGYTYGGHAGAAAAAMANLDIVERENLLGESKRLEASLHTHLQPLAEHPRVAALIAPLVLRDQSQHRFLASPLALAIGRWSYGLFIWHLAVLNAVFPVFGIVPFSGSFFYVLALTVVLSVAVASASYALVEEPARVAVTRWEKRRHIGEPAKGNAANPVTTKATNVEN
ncbi:aminotransferase class III-fold pyridoxal phosphate-dependent enzyme, partial [Streptomyces sp. NPDC002130]|uniref:aminotransferase class III-fold pyridoxal phosphate-dependent enzyme n=1 Tax=Streptomyces sp. NPDC002130 TaxID=3155568 RepID=UPI00332E8161